LFRFAIPFHDFLPNVVIAVPHKEVAGVEEGPREAFGEGEDAKVGVWVLGGEAMGGQGTLSRVADLMASLSERTEKCE
jgi:hypothetical protein